MTRRFTSKEVNRIIEDGERLGVSYSEEEKEILKELVFEKAFITDEAIMIIKPQGHKPVHDIFTSNEGPKKLK